MINTIMIHFNCKNKQINKHEYILKKYMKYFSKTNHVRFILIFNNFLSSVFRTICTIAYLFLYRIMTLFVLLFIFSFTRNIYTIDISIYFLRCAVRQSMTIWYYKRT